MLPFLWQVHHQKIMAQALMIIPITTKRRVAETVHRGLCLPAMTTTTTTTTCLLRQRQPQHPSSFAHHLFATKTTTTATTAGGGSRQKRGKQHQRKFQLPVTFMTTDDDDGNDDSSSDNDDEDGDMSITTTTTTIDASNKKTLTSLWNIPMLKKEVTRSILRCHKKIGKAMTRLEQQIDNSNIERSQLEQELQEFQHRLQLLNQLEQELSGMKNKEQGTLPESVVTLVLRLNLSDEPAAAKPERGTPKPKGPRRLEPHRLPYRRYYSKNKVEIRVGKQAEDNDELSLSPLHRDASDWWMHASGCPGSHVVIRSHSMSSLDEDVIQDAAALAARQSKCTGTVRRVSMTQCRHVTKPPGAKAGLVQLNGPVRTIVVNMNDAKTRLARLDETVLVN